MEPGCHGNHQVIRGLGHSVSPIALSGGEGLEVEHMLVLGGQCVQRGHESSGSFSSYLALCIFSIWLFPSCILL